MASKPTRPLNEMSVLLQAEPFGFGPAAAIADCFPHLVNVFGKVGYAGTGHTLDLQRKLPYSAIHDLSAVPSTSLDEHFTRLAGMYDIVLTALDFDFARRARAVGMPVCIYDPLTWYWKDIPDVVRECTYIAQDFFGVKDRLKKEAHRFASTHVVSSLHVVPPLVPNQAPKQGPRSKVLLNLGGLSNPSWSVQGTLGYARLIVEEFFAGTGIERKDVVIAANSRVAEALAEYDARNYSRDEMHSLIPSCSWALMTPGLGNIYDVARHNTPTVWLPPANDSQGQQLHLLTKHGMADASIDWFDIVSDAGIDYMHEQQTVLAEIYATLGFVLAFQSSRKKLASLFGQRRDAIVASLSNGSRTSELIGQFGAGGAEQVAKVVIAQARKGDPT